jgi:hypothetical protein
MNRIRDVRGGKTNDPRFGHRLQGEGIFAEMIQRRFDKVIKKLGLNQPSRPLNRDLFRPHPEQMDLF